MSRNTFAIVGLVFFIWYVAALSLPGFIMQDGSGYLGATILWQAGFVLGTGVPYGFAWWANVLGVWAFFASRSDGSKTSVLVALAAVLLSLGSFIAVGVQLPNDSLRGAASKVATLGPGFYVWEALLVTILFWSMYRFMYKAR